MGSSEREGIWVVAELDGHRAIIGRIKGVGSKLNPSVKETVLGMKRLELVDVYDFFAPLRPVQQRMPDGSVGHGVTRDPIVTGNHFTYDECPVYVQAALISKFFFFDEMSPADRNRYESFLGSADDVTKQKRLAESGLVAPPPGGLPPLPGVLDLSKMSRNP